MRPYRRFFWPLLYLLAILGAIAAVKAFSLRDAIITIINLLIFVGVLRFLSQHVTITLHHWIRRRLSSLSRPPATPPADNEPV